MTDTPTPATLIDPRQILAARARRDAAAAAEAEAQAAQAEVERLEAAKAKAPTRKAVAAEAAAAQAALDEAAAAGAARLGAEVDEYRALQAAAVDAVHAAAEACLAASAARGRAHYTARQMRSALDAGDPRLAALPVIPAAIRRWPDSARRRAVEESAAVVRQLDMAVEARRSTAYDTAEPKAKRDPDADPRRQIVRRLPESVERAEADRAGLAALGAS